MTTLRVGWEEGRIRRFSMRGHTGFAPAGSDIVCAAASILAATCANALESVAGILPLVERGEREALMVVTLPAGMDGQAAETAQVIMRTVLQGFKDLSEAYPKHFSIVD